MVRRLLLRYWRSPSAAERYLAAATDTADLERRARVLDRGSGMTFDY